MSIQDTRYNYMTNQEAECFDKVVPYWKSSNQVTFI